MIKGFVCGVFDLFHPGHVLMLDDCKKKCDVLTVESPSIHWSKGF